GPRLSVRSTTEQPGGVHALKRPGKYVDDHDLPQHLAALQRLHSVVEVGESDAGADQRLQVELPGLVELGEVREVVPHVRFPVQTRQQVLALEEQAEGGDGDHVVGRARADHDDVAAGAGELPGGLDGGGFADDFEAVVEAAAAGEFGEGGGDFLRGDGVGGADLLGQFVLGLERVDGEDGAGPGDARALDHGEADAAAADDGDGGAGADLGGVDGGADAGGDAAADERGGFPRHFGVDLHHADGRDHDLFGPGAAAGHAVGGGVGAEAEVALGEGLDDVLHAQERLPAEAQVAFLAGGPPADHDVVAGLDGADVLADFHDL